MIRDIDLLNIVQTDEERRWKMAGTVRVPNIIYKQRKGKQKDVPSALRAKEIQACGWQTDRGWQEAAHVSASSATPQ